MGRRKTKKNRDGKVPQQKGELDKKTPGAPSSDQPHLLSNSGDDPLLLKEQAAKHLKAKDETSQQAINGRSGSTSDNWRIRSSGSEIAETSSKETSYRSVLRTETWTVRKERRARYHTRSEAKDTKEKYMELSQQPSVVLNEPIPKKLLILDLNGTLASRTKRRDSMFVRPYQDKFMDFIFGYFDVMVWSSAQPQSVADMCRLFEGREKELILKWDRTMLGLTPAQYNRKTATIKDLEKVWAALDNKYDATNTVLLDDSPDKAQLQPYNSVHLSEFKHTSATFLQHGERELLHVMRYLSEVRLQSNVCGYMRLHPYVPPDAAQDEDNENLLEAYHYVFSQQRRQLAQFQRKAAEAEAVEAVVQQLESTKI